MTLSDLRDDLARQFTINADENRYIWEHTVRPLLSAELIEEHRRNPIGRHSPALDMVLAFLRSDPLPTEPRLVVIILEPERTWAIGEHSRRKGVPVYVRPETFDSIDEIEHAIFLERLRAVEDAFRTAAG
jgi:hypothetical protein